jgi:hypothetical protein
VDIQKIVLGIGLILFVAFLGVHLLSSEYEGTHILIFAGFMISIIGALWRFGEERSRHYHDRDAPWNWLATSLFMTIGGIAVVALGIFYAFDAQNYRLFVVSGFGLGAILLGRWLAKKWNNIKIKDELWPDSYPCPICGQVVDRYERSCYGCGSVVWSVMQMREGVFQLPPEKRRKNSAVSRRPNRT